ncbi:UNKNOWN [Stylonychia lemnae]|uniref:Uncharacterized protein n=1 Tax=Stylonychia lemnae TaxID=5949 RepID=A0A078B419_STYLE|nr:UNKNOWN [Stylonychia lemnae]|eukprot:CDW87937.1 UNKNOWN [Stylonychia lemnae]
MTTFYDVLNQANDSVVSIRNWASNFIQQTTHREELLKQLINLYEYETIIYSSSKTQKDIEKENSIIENQDNFQYDTEVLIFDNENYENTILRMEQENNIARDRVVETRNMITRYERSTLKWMNICRESEITNNDINLRSTTLATSLNVEKQVQLMKLHQRQNQLRQLDQMISDYDKELEHIKDQEIDAQGRCFILKRRLQYLNQRKIEFGKKKAYWSEKLQYVQLKFFKLQKRFKQRGVTNFEQLQRILVDEVIPKVIQKQSLENQSKDYLQRIMDLQSLKGNLEKHLKDLKSKSNLQFQDSLVSQYQIRLDEMLDNNKRRIEHLADRLVVNMMDNISMLLPRVDPRLFYAGNLPEREKLTVIVIDINQGLSSTDDDNLDVKTGDLDVLEKNKPQKIRIYFNLTLGYESLYQVYKAYFTDNLPEDEQQKKISLMLRRKKTLRSIGMDMVKKQANIMINSKKSTDFEVYFHTKRQTDKMRKEMQSEIKEIQKQKNNAKLKDQFQEALRANIEKLQQKEIIKQEIQAQNNENMNKELKNLFAENQNIIDNPFIKKKWEAQNMYHYRNIQEKYRHLRQKLDKNNAIDFNVNNQESALTFQAQKMRQRQHWDRIIQGKQQKEVSSSLKIESNTKDDTSQNTKLSINYKSNSTARGSAAQADYQRQQIFACSSPFLQMVKNPSQCNLIKNTQIPQLKALTTRNSNLESIPDLKSQRIQIPLKQHQEQPSSQQQSKSPIRLKKSGTASKLTLPNIDHTPFDKVEKSERSESTLKNSTFQKNFAQLTNPYSQKFDFTSASIGSLTARSNQQHMIRLTERKTPVVSNGKMLYKVMVKDQKNKVIESLFSRKNNNQIKNNILSSDKQQEQIQLEDL